MSNTRQGKVQGEQASQQTEKPFTCIIIIFIKLIICFPPSSTVIRTL